MAKAKATQIHSHAQTWTDFKNAILIISLLVNVTILIVWLVLKLTAQYDTVLSHALLGR